MTVSPHVLIFVVLMLVVVWLSRIDENRQNRISRQRAADAEAARQRAAAES